MNKTTKIIISIIVILILLLGISYATYDFLKEKPASTNPQINEVQDEKVKNDDTNITNILEDDNVEDDIVKENTETQDEKQEEVEQENTIIPPDNSQNISTDPIKSEEEIAIELVKKQWGDNTDGVYIQCDGINNDGRYIVAVRDQETTKNLAWYFVDVESKTVEEQ